MVSGTILDCVDHLFRDICDMHRIPFAGKVVVLGGDFRQVLPVIRRADKSHLLSETIKQSPLWKHFHTCQLTVNQRAGRSTEGKEFAKWLLKVGNGEINLPDQPDSMMLDVECRLKQGSELIKEIYDVKKLNNPRHVLERTILTPYN